MGDLVKLVKTYRVTVGLAERLRLAEQIIRAVEPDLRLFVFNALRNDCAQDVLQETLNAIATGARRFQGNSEREFWGWCYRIARNKIIDQLRKQTSDRLQPMPYDALWELVEASAQASPVSAHTRIDLKDAVARLAKAKPECYDFLWSHYVIGLDYGELAEERQMSYDAVRMKVNRCLDEAQSLMA